VSGQVYRSAQLNGSALRSEINAYHIKTIINLRGYNPNDLWYRDEIAICRDMAVKHVDIGLSAIRLPKPEKLDKLLATFDHAEYPILLHCKAGSDRSGLAATLYCAIYRHEPVTQAKADELTWRYGHFSRFSAKAMDQFFDLYLRTNPNGDIRQWITTTYPVLYRERVDAPNNTGNSHE